MAAEQARSKDQTKLVIILIIGALSLVVPVMSLGASMGMGPILAIVSSVVGMASAAYAHSHPSVFAATALFFAFNVVDGATLVASSVGSALWIAFCLLGVAGTVLSAVSFLDYRMG